MKTFLYPTVLQKKSMSSVKSTKNSNIIIRYTEFNGIKLTVFLPLLHNQIKNAIMQMAEEKPQMTYSSIVTHSQSRSMIVADFLKDLTHFCKEMVTVINLDESTDLNDALAQIRKAKESDAPGMSLVVIGTPGVFVKLLKENKDVGKYYSIVLDKVDLLQAFGFKPELVEIAELLKLAESPVDGKVIITSTVQNESLDE